jgi:hypothetical protein
MYIFVEKPRRSTTAPVFFALICKPIQQTCIFQTLETHPSFCSVYFSFAGLMPFILSEP